MFVFYRYEPKLKSINKAYNTKLQRNPVVSNIKQVRGQAQSSEFISWTLCKEGIKTCALASTPETQNIEL